MKKSLKFISYLGLALSIVPALFFFTGAIGKPVYLNLLIVGMVMWFGTAIFWVKRGSAT